MVNKCRTRVFICEDSEMLRNEIKTLNKIASYYFVIYENKIVYLERASLILGTEKDIKKEKVFLIRKLNNLKERLWKF